jgi:hypothetical protein
MKATTPSPKDRLQQFFIFCDALERHPFFLRYVQGGKMRVDGSFPADGNDQATVNFDEVHLESLLTRLRQFLSDGELFFYKDIRRAIVSLFEDDESFRSFYDQLVTAIQSLFTKKGVQFFREDGKDVVAGYNLKQLMEAQLYTGAIHSERILSPIPGSAEESLPNSHIAAKKHLLLNLAYGSMRCVENICALRNWALRRARAVGQVNLFSELKQFDERSRQAGF